MYGRPAGKRSRSLATCGAAGTRRCGRTERAGGRAADRPPQRAANRGPRRRDGAGEPRRRERTDGTARGRDRQQAGAAAATGSCSPSHDSGWTGGDEDGRLLLLRRAGGRTAALDGRRGGGSAGRTAGSAATGKKNGTLLCSAASTQATRGKMGLRLGGDAAPRSKTKLPGAAQQRRRVADWISLELCYHVTNEKGRVNCLYIEEEALWAIYRVQEDNPKP